MQTHSQGASVLLNADTGQTPQEIIFIFATAGFIVNLLVVVAVPHGRHPPAPLLTTLLYRGSTNSPQFMHTHSHLSCVFLYTAIGQRLRSIIRVFAVSAGILANYAALCI
ncbi:hypothetical protein [Microtetraspora fusca]|uniref:hypothetical protein n=1 Tax=Microtetraspora fusca TaxID=1997 RepID=UPI0012FCEDA4|nr:hypothetical protein [Microtetraspora fusca]